jgi:indolepyruvate decarboxylase
MRTPLQPTQRQASRTTVGRFLATRLRQLGVDHLFGLPGDFNLALIDEMLAGSGLEWVGSTNELNAAYAADGYARQRGFGALVTTFGVGELSAINGVAGSYAESVPVLQITGAPETGLVSQRSMSHHTLIDGDFGHFRRAYEEVTVAAESLTADDPAGQIDRVLTAMVTNSRPGYLSIPADLVTCSIPAVALGRPILPPPSDPEALEAFRVAAAERLGDATDITLLTGHLIGRQGLHHRIAEVAVTGAAAVAFTLGGRSIEGGGVYIGGLTPDPGVRAAVEECDALILAGVVFSDITSGMFTHRIDNGTAITLDLHRARVGPDRFEGVRLADAVDVIVDLLVPTVRARPAAPLTPLAPLTTADRRDWALLNPAAPGASTVPLTHDQLWTELEQWIPPRTTVLADAGTAYYGAVGMQLAPGCEVVGQPYWSSIGYTLPALLGTELACPGSRPVLFIGDGAAQLTVQELATILHRHLDVVIFVLNNGGYSIERQIRSPDAVYQDITAWDWTSLPTALGQADHGTIMPVGSLRQLRLALAATDVCRPGTTLIELRLHRDDAPALLSAIASGLRPAGDHRGSEDLARTA